MSTVLPRSNSIDIRDQYIAQVVSGKTFAEVGGLWGTVSEKISIAHRYNATSLTMIDVASPDTEAYLWQAFHERMAALNITDYRCLMQDVCQIRREDIEEPFDVVHCAGVLYHNPHPMQLLVALRQITRQYLVLTSAITQEAIENEKGRYQIPPSGVIFLPALNQEELNILGTYWNQFCSTPPIGISEKTAYCLDDFSPWWWLPTATALKSMCEVAGFQVIESELAWHNNALSLLLEVQVKQSVPPLPEISGDKPGFKRYEGDSLECKTQVNTLQAESKIFDIKVKLDCCRETLASGSIAVDNPSNLEETHLTSEELDQAFSDCENLLETLALTSHKIGKILQMSGNLEEAKTWFATAVEILPEFADAQISLGYALYKLWQIDLAVASYRQAIKLNSQSWEAYHFLGLALATQGQIDEAIIHYRRAIELNPKGYWSHQRLGEVLGGSSCQEEAARCYRYAIKLNPKFYLSYLSLGTVLEHQNKLKGAIAYYQRAVELNPDAFIIHHHLGCALAKQGQLGAAISAYYRAIELNPDFCWSYHCLGDALMQERQWHEAATCYRKAIELKPNSDSYIKLGDALTGGGSYYVFHWVKNDLIEAGTLDEAIACYQKSIRLNLNDSPAYLRLGNAFTAMGKIDEAIQNYRMACYQTTIRSNPQFIHANWAIDNLHYPDFLIIGIGKGGTTSLYQYLSFHPQVIPALQKETNFFNNYFENGDSWYSSQFPPLIKGEKFMTGEATPSYLVYPNVHHRVFSLLPNVKIIVLLRNPIDRAVSHYYHMVRENQESRTLDEAMLSEIELLKATSESELINGDCYSKTWGYILNSLYFYDLSRWMQLFPKEQFLILKSEDLYEKSSEIMQQVLTFLDLPNHSLQTYPNYHPGYYTSSINDALYSTMAEFFQPYNNRLQELLETGLFD